uniref:Carnitine O-palmitoyltransferase 2, mitochondrial n=1 Tax=Ornithorhynchus anatinus TaxID=9258 RepID=A0A6I8N4C2_ORNAN
MARYLLFSLAQRSIRVADVTGSRAFLRKPPVGLDSPRGFGVSRCRPSDYLHKSIVNTLHYQESLPRKTEKLSQNFKEGIGKELHEHLVAQDELRQDTSYYSEMWLNTYLTLRSPLAFSTNVGLAFHLDPNPSHNDQLTRATNLTVSALRFLKTFRAGYLEPEVLHLYPEKTDTEEFKKLIQFVPPSLVCNVASMVNVYPLDMSQFFRLFNTTRLPRPGRDELFTDEKGKHVLVLRKGNFYVFDVLDQERNIVKAVEIQAHLKSILADDLPVPEFPLAYLTSENRDIWAQLRQELLDNGNEEALRKVDSAMFCLCLDDFPIQNSDHLSHNMLHGDGMNRWFDKSFNLILTQDGQAAVHFEHSWGDVLTFLRFLDEVSKDSSRSPAVTPQDQSEAVAADSCTAATRLEFRLNGAIKAGISKAKENFDLTRRTLTLRFVEFASGGRNFLKDHKVSPDAMVQLSYQMAFRVMHGQTVPTDEFCSTATFKHGRTEIIRPASVLTNRAAKALVQEPSPRSVEELQGLLADSSHYHVRLIKEAAMGQGFDRHLYALRNLSASRREALPEFFQDPAYVRLNHIILSTRAIASPLLKTGVVAPATPDGFGVVYSIHKDCLTFSISCYSVRDAQEFSQVVITGLEKIVAVLRGKPDKI